ncbi:hypothetical protein PCE1_001163 [Barthelona sp. PCE]
MFFTYKIVVFLGVLAILAHGNILSYSSEPQYEIGFTIGAVDDITLETHYPCHLIKDATERMFNCCLPRVDPNEQESFLQVNTSKTIYDVLDQLRGLTAYYRTGGWFDFTLKWEESVEQFHMNEKREKEQVFSLGKYNPAEFTSQIEHDAQEQPYYSFVYDDGEHCGISNEPRTVDVQLKCGLHKEPLFVTKVIEKKTCEYVMEASTPHLCDLFGFQQSVTKKPSLAICRLIPEAGKPIIINSNGGKIIFEQGGPDSENKEHKMRFKEV